MFWILHIFAAFLLPFALFLTIPLHIIYESNNKVIKKDQYDLDAALQLAGVDEHRSLSLCHLIDSRGRVDLTVRKALAQIFLRQKVYVEDARVIFNAANHIFKEGSDFKELSSDFDKFKSSIKGF